MKKIATLFLVILALAGLSASAQTTACNPDFNYTFQTPNTVQFTPVLPGIPATTMHYWWFGDGGISNAITPVHTFINGTVFSVKHLVIQLNPNGVEVCRDSMTKTIIIQTNCNLVANFIATPTPGTNGGFHFENTSTPVSNIDSVRWTFGDGTSATSFHADHVYTQPGTYTVCLRIQKFTAAGTVSCVREICQAITVPVPTTCNLVVNFTITPISAINSFHFENTTIPLNNTDSIKWTFGDGTSTNVVSPNHTYTQPGTYTVCLRVIQRTANGSLSNCARDICHTFTIPNPTTCNLVANFSFTFAQTAPNTIYFQNTSVPINVTDSIRWTFGDGTSSNQVNPVHTFAQPGTYNVCLRIQQRDPNGGLTNCIREVCHTVGVISPTTCNLVANFTSTLVQGTPNSFYFQNTSVPLNPLDSVRWTFGDGTSSNLANPLHTYTQPGTYNVCLRVQQREPSGVLTNCIREICHTVVVQSPTTCNLVVGFNIIPTSAVNTFHFQNNTVPLNNTDSIRWTFGDGTSSNDVNPNHTYAQPGTYTICLTVWQRTAAGVLTNCVRTWCNTIIIPNPNTCNLIANFTTTLVQTAPFTFHFQNTSVPLNPTDSIRWTFGDGTSSNLANPNHTYTQPGTYNVCLRMQQRDPNGGLTNCIREKCYNVYVQGPNSCNMVVNFVPSYLGQNTFHFANTSTSINTTDSIRWTFGDGTSTNIFSPTHTYTSSGTYNVCLRIIRYNTPGTAPCIREICHAVTVQGPPPTACNLLVNFYSFRDTLSPTPQPFLYQFVNTSAPVNNTDSVRWSFGDGTTSNQLNPSHAYAQPGIYYVCLRIQKRDANGALTNCVREICHSVFAGQVLPPVSCFLQVYPNPVTNFVNISITLQQPQMIDIYIYNSMNMLVIERHQPGFAGNNTITIPASNLTTGIYRMKVVRGNAVCYAQFLKL